MIAPAIYKLGERNYPLAHTMMSVIPAYAGIHGGRI